MADLIKAIVMAEEENIRLHEELAKARAENERLLNVVRSMEAKADGHYEGRYKPGPEDWLWVRAMCRDVMKEGEL